MVGRWWHRIAASRRQVPPPRRARLVLEMLESRALPAVTFSLPVDYPTGAFATSQTVGDFNGDGNLDLAVVNRGADTVSVLLGNGDGTFHRAVNYPVGSNPVYVAEGDFRGIGILDLVVANRDSGTVSVLLGNGDGSFHRAVNYRTGTEPFSVAVGDFDGDGNLDLAVTDFGDGNNNGSGLSILLGNGDGTFALAATYAAGLHPVFAAAGDFRGSGALDLAVVDFGDNSGQANGVRVFWGNGDGTFRATGFYRTGLSPSSVAVADLNGDGNPDLVVTNDVTNGTVSVLLGQGDGTFQNAVNYPAGSSPRHAAIADLDGDGTLDLAVANTAFTGGTPSVSVLLGNGDGTFLPPQNLAVNSFPASVAAADFNGDGLPDLAVTSYMDGNMTILRNTTPVFSRILVAGFPSPITAGSPGAFAVIARHADGTIAADYQGTVHFTSTDTQAVLPDDYTFQAADTGVHVFFATLLTPGSQDLTATDTGDGSITGTQPGIVVTAPDTDPSQVDARAAAFAKAPLDVTPPTLDADRNIVAGNSGGGHFPTADRNPVTVLPSAGTSAAGDGGGTLTWEGGQASTVLDPDRIILGENGAAVFSPADQETLTL